MDDEAYGSDETITNDGPESRQPTVEDLLELCRELTSRRAKYLIVGGSAIRGAGYIRETNDLDVSIDTEPENEARVLKSLEIPPDKAVPHLQPGEVEKYTVIRVVEGVPIRFASPRLLWRMKHKTDREKDVADLIFLRQQYPEVTGE